MLALQALYNRALTGSFLKPPSALTSLNLHEGLFWQDHISLAQALTITYTHLTVLDGVVWGWKAGVAMLFLTLPFVLLSRNRRDYFVAGGCLAVVAAWLFYPLPSVQYGPRLWFALLPLLALGAARGALLAVGRAQQLGRFLRTQVWLSPKPSWAEVLPAVAMSLALLMLGVSSWKAWWSNGAGRPAYPFVPQSVAGLKAFQGVDARIPAYVAGQNLHHAVVLVAPCGGWQCYGSVLPQNDASLNGDVVYAIDQPGVDVAQLYPGRQIVWLDYNKLPPA